MRTLISLLILLAGLSTGRINAQKANSGDCPDRLPKDLKLDESIVRSYRMSTNYYDYDQGNNTLRKQRLTGILSYEGDSAQWKEVYYSSSGAFEIKAPQAKKMNLLQGFTYQPDAKVLTGTFFREHLPEAGPLVMNLIWDALAFHALAYECWDSLRLNEEYRATAMNAEMEIAAIGTFENRDIRITWIGTTEINNETCAILKYSAMNNLLDVNYENLSMKGKSHYWGKIYVSLSDKQIEYATLTEDVFAEVKPAGADDTIPTYTARTIHLSRLQK